MTRSTFSRGRGGFSLLELCVVMAILAIILAIGFIYMARARANAALDGAATEMYNALAYTRQAAMSSSGANMAFGSGDYTVATSGGVTLKHFSLPPGVTLTVPTAMNPLTFSANGSASAGGTFTMQSTTGRTATLTVQALAGTASVTIR